MQRFMPLAAALLSVSTLACGTYQVPLRYEAVSAPGGVDRAVPLISLGAFLDQRAKDYGPDWLGAIRGGYGNRLKTLRTEKPMQDVVQEAFADGLRVRGAFAEPGQGKYVLEGTIVKLDCSEYFNLEAHAHVDLRVLDAATRSEVYSWPYRVDETEGGLGAGILGSVETLRLLAERTLRELVDRALDDPALRRKLYGP